MVFTASLRREEGDTSQVSMCHSSSLTSPVTYILAAPLPSTSSSTTPRNFAVAYTDGSMRLWSYDPSTPEVETSEIVTFNGHKKSITTMAFDSEGSRLASGGTEGEIVIWDRIAEVGLFRLKGHRGPVTAIHFIPHPTESTPAHPGFLVSTAKDTYLKLWDLSTQHCLQTIVVGRREVWSCAIREEDEEDQEVDGMIDGEGVRGRWVIVTGSSDGEGKAWVIEKSALAGGIKENVNGEVSGSFLSLNEFYWLFLAPNPRSTTVQPTPSIVFPTRFTSSLPSNTPASLPSDIRSYYQHPSIEDGCGSIGEADKAEEAGTGEGEEEGRGRGA